MLKNEIAFTPAWRLAELIKSKELSPVEIAEVFLERIEKLNPRLNAYLTVTHDITRAQARGAEEVVMKGGELPPLHGVPVSIKGLVRTRGIRTTFGSLVYKDNVPTEDDICVTRLRGAGAVIMGKTNTPEFGKSALTKNRLGEDCRTPWDIERASAGSSGGAASAVAAGLVPIAQGGDGGGSIRMPASFCGVFGLKPTLGRVAVSRPDGIVPFHAVQGPITRTVRDAALMLNAMAGYDRGDLVSIKEPPPDYLRALDGDIAGLRMAWSPDLSQAIVAREVLSVTESAVKVFESLGCHVEAATPAIGEPFGAHSIIANMPFYAIHGRLLEEHADELTDYVTRSLEFAGEVSGWEYHNALCERLRLRRVMAEFHEKYDLLLTPTMCVPPILVGQVPEEIDGRPLDGTSLIPFMSQFNVTGQPAATVPCGFTSNGLPVGLQMVGRWCDETTILKASAAFERAQPWSHRIPPICQELS